MMLSVRYVLSFSLFLRERERKGRETLFDIGWNNTKEKIAMSRTYM